MATVGASYGGQVSGSGTFRSELERYASRFAASIDFLSEGGPPVSTPTTISELLDLAQMFPTLVTEQNAYPLDVSTTSYYSAANFPICPALPDSSGRILELERLSSSHDRARELTHFLRRRLSMGGRLSEATCTATAARLNSHLGDLEQYLRDLEAAAASCWTGSTCDSRLVVTPSLEQQPRVPPSCGPFCASGGRSEPALEEIDNFGFCTHCRWEYGSPYLVANGAVDATHTCSAMRPGARVGVTYMAHLDIPNNPSTAWVDVGLRSPGLVSPDCTPPGSACTLASNAAVAYDMILASHGFGPLDGVVSGQVAAARCTGGNDSSCRLGPMTSGPVSMDVCDTDNARCP